MSTVDCSLRMNSKAQELVTENFSASQHTVNSWWEESHVYAHQYNR